MRQEADRRGLTLRVMFQDEARFGRVRQPARCWAPSDIRPIVGQQIIREYTYAYAAVSPLQGDLDSLILPDMYGDTMAIFLDEVSQRYPESYILMVMDGAPCHRSQMLKIPNNIRILPLPPYSPQLNPTENIWGEMREKWFSNKTFEDMESVEDQMVVALQALDADKDRVKSIAGFQWIVDSINTI